MDNNEAPATGTREPPTPPPACSRRHWVGVVVMAFLGYAAFVAVPMLVLSPHPGQTLTTVQVILSFAGAVALGVRPQARATFELVRVTLALWALRALYVTVGLITGQIASGTPPPPTHIRVLVMVGTLALGVLCWLFACSRGSRRYYGL